MAKSKKAKISLSTRDNKVATLPVAGVNGLPEYRRYIDSRDNKYRLFFEEPQSIDEVTDLRYPKKSYCRASKYSKNGKDGFMIVRDGVALVGEKIAQTFAQLVIKKLSQKEPSASEITDIHSALRSFFKFISTLDSPPISSNELSINHISCWIDSIDVNSAKIYKQKIKNLLELHPILAKRDITAVKVREKSISIKDVTKVDLDKIKGELDYSDKELIQMLAYVLYEIELAQKHFKALEETSIAELGDDYISLDNINIQNTTITKLLQR